MAQSRSSALAAASVVALGGLLFTTSAIGSGLKPTSAPASQRPDLIAACEAWSLHVRELIYQHREIEDLAEDDLHIATDRLYAAEAYCSLGLVRESFAIYERISLGRGKQRLW